MITDTHALVRLYLSSAIIKANVQNGCGREQQMKVWFTASSPTNFPTLGCSPCLTKVVLTTTNRWFLLHQNAKGSYLKASR